MLTQEQKDRLNLLTSHERYGQLLIDAMKTWETATPKQLTYGITRCVENHEAGCFTTKYDIDPCYDNCCCLIGGALVGKCSDDSSYRDSIMNIYNLSESEFESLIKGFDLDDEINNEAYRFGKSVSAIIFMK